MYPVRRLFTQIGVKLGVLQDVDSNDRVVLIDEGAVLLQQHSPGLRAQGLGFGV